MNSQKFEELIQDNAHITNQNLNSRLINLQNFNFFGGKTGKEVSYTVLGRRFFDIFGCSVIGALPSLEPHGADGYVWMDDIGYVEVETKVSSIFPELIHVGPKNGLIWSSDPSNPYNYAALTSVFSGNYDIRMQEQTLSSKERWTALVIFDNKLNSVIDAWLMEPHAILKQIRARKNNKSINIKLSCFLQHGFHIPCRIPTIGWHNWLEMQTKDAIKNNRRFYRKNY